MALFGALGSFSHICEVQLFYGTNPDKYGANLLKTFPEMKEQFEKSVQAALDVYEGESLLVRRAIRRGFVNRLKLSERHAERLFAKKKFTPMMLAAFEASMRDITEPNSTLNSTSR